MIKITGDIAGFRKQLALEQARLDREISAAYVGWTRRIFAEVVQGSAQWSGDLVANFNYAVGQPDYSYARIANKTGDSKKIDYWKEDQGVFQAGHPYAVEAAMLRMAEAPVPTWRDPVFISNMTPTEDGSDLEEALADGRIKVRPVNLVGGVVVTIYTVAMLEAQRTTV